MGIKGSMNAQGSQQGAISGADINETMTVSDKTAAGESVETDLDDNMSDIDAMLRDLNLDMRGGRRMPEQDKTDLFDSQDEFGEVSIEDMLKDVEIKDRSKREEVEPRQAAADGDLAGAFPVEDPRERKRREKQARKQAKEEAKAIRKSKKAKRDKSEENTDGQENPPKAGGLKGLFNKLTEDVDEEEEQEGAKDKGISDEFDEDLPDSAKDAKKTDQKKKAKADQKAKAQKEKGKKAAEKNKAKAKTKTAKAKPAKKGTKPKTEEKPGKRLKKGSVLIIVIFAASVLGLILFVNMLLSPILEKRGAEAAFREKDYVSCYRLLAGMKLSDEEMKTQQYAEVVLKMERKMAGYEYYTSISGELEALDCLMTAVADYGDLYQQAAGCGAEREVGDIYAHILGILAEKYGLSEDAAKRIVACESDLEYTRCLTGLIAGDGAGQLPGMIVPPGTEDSSGANNLPETETDVPDPLPEEQEMTDVIFSD